MGQLLVRDNGGVDRKPIPAGPQVAVCITVADLGIEVSKKFGKEQHKVYIGWELPEVRIEFDDPQTGAHYNLPATIGKTFTASLSQKANLRTMLESWRGRPFTPAELAGFDLFTILKAPCLMQIFHKTGDDGKIYNEIGSIMSLPRGMQRPVPERDVVSYSESEPSMFEKLPKWLQEKIGRLQHEAQLRAASKGNGVQVPQGTVTYLAKDDPLDDDIPFSFLIGIPALGFIAEMTNGLQGLL